MEAGSLRDEANEAFAGGGYPELKAVPDSEDWVNRENIRLAFDLVDANLAEALPDGGFRFRRTLMSPEVELTEAELRKADPNVLGIMVSMATCEKGALEHYVTGIPTYLSTFKEPVAVDEDTSAAA